MIMVMFTTVYKYNIMLFTPDTITVTLPWYNLVLYYGYVTLQLIYLGIL